MTAETIASAIAFQAEKKKNTLRTAGLIDIFGWMYHVGTLF